ncbi:MAG: hypothetical protein Q9166_001052 [cf. Caloplaca sp. 2 TL-2023]
MGTPEDPTHNSWAYQSSRPSSNVSYNHVGPSNSNSPVHAAPFVPMYPSPHGQPPSNMSERQRHILELTARNRQNFVPQHPINGSGPRPPYFNFPTQTPFQPQNIPHLPPHDGLNQKQRHARDLIIQLDEDKKLLLKSRKQTAAELKRLTSEMENLEATQRGMEHLRFIYPIQTEISKMQGFHDSYGREWDKVEELLEICWAELMVPESG